MSRARRNGGVERDFDLAILTRERASSLCGIDEVGCGALAGPVAAACVVLDYERLPEGLDDSKRLTRSRRACLAEEIRKSARATGIGFAQCGEIDRFNIRKATHLAMRRAFVSLSRHFAPELVLVDGRACPDALPLPARAIVGGDGLSPAIAAASILAKVARDTLMIDLASAYPAYGWECNMGYGTRVHRAAILRLGATCHHRRSFSPMRELSLRKGDAPNGA